MYSGTRFPLGTPFGKRAPFFHGVLAMQSALALLLVRALKPQQPLLAVEAAGISVKRAVGCHHAMARHDNRNGITRDRSPHRTRRHNGRFISRYTMSGGNTLGDLTIRSDLATRNRKQFVPDFTLKRRTDHMQRRRKPRFLPCKISIQPSPRTLKHRRRRTICGTYRRHTASTRNRIGAFNMFGIFFEKRRAKVLLPLKPKPRQTAAISGKQDFAQRRSKRRRDHQRLLSKLRKHNTANCADNPADTSGRARNCLSEAVSPIKRRRRRASTPERYLYQLSSNTFPRSERVKTKPQRIRTFRPKNRRIRAAKPQEIAIKICQCFGGPNKVVHFTEKY